jgi:hypothetical protein
MGNKSIKNCLKENSNNRMLDPLIAKNLKEKQTDENYKEYFKLVNMKLRRYYEENKNSQINLSICLEKKDFNTVITTKKLVYDPNQSFIYWKKYFLTYLNKQSQKGCVWSNDLYEY